MNISRIKRTYSLTTSENFSKHLRIKHDDNLPNKLNPYEYFSHERPFTNLKINLNEQILWCDKSSLSTASPVFHEQILKLNKDDLLIYDDINLKDFLTMLEFIYPIFNPEINQTNISALIELSYRFQFDMLKHACQLYVMKYLSTIRRVLNNYNHRQDEGDYIVNNNQYRQHDLIQFHDRTCIDALDIIINLCRWLKTFYKNHDSQLIESITSVLQQISVDYLEQAIMTVDIDENIKVYIYKQRAHYLENDCLKNV